MTLILRMRERRRRPAPAEAKLRAAQRQGNVSIPQEAFIAALRMGEEGAYPARSGLIERCEVED